MRNDVVTLPSSWPLIQLYNRVVTRPSTGGEIFGIVFGGIFAAVGIFAAGTLLLSNPGQSQENAWVGVLIAAVFAVIGCGIIYASIYGTRKIAGASGSRRSQSSLAVALAHRLGGQSSGKHAPQQRHGPLAVDDILECDCVHGCRLNLAETLAQFRS